MHGPSTPPSRPSGNFVESTYSQEDVFGLELQKEGTMATKRSSISTGKRTSEGSCKAASRASSKSGKKASRGSLNKRLLLKAVGVLLLVSLMIAACLVVFISEEQRKREDFRTSVMDLGEVYAGEIQRQVRSSVSSVRAIEAMIKVDDKNMTINNFDAIAHTLIDTYGGITNLQLAPFGTVLYVHPLVGNGMDNRKAIGHALLVDPNRRGGALLAIQRQRTTVIGPLRLFQGGVAILARHPIFSKYAPEFTPSESWTKAGTTYTSDCDTAATRMANCYFPGPMEGNTTPTYFWGFATMLTLVSDLLGPIQLERLSAGHHHRISGVDVFSYQLSATTPHPSMEAVGGIFAHSPDAPPGTSLPDAVKVRIAVPELNVDFQLCLAPADGWPATSRDFWVQVALLFPLTILVAVGLGFALLGNLRNTYVRAKSLEQYRMQRLTNTVTSAVSDMDRLRFPMCLISVEEFERLGELRPHEAVRDEGKLRFIDSTEIMRQLRDSEGVVFVSHQWVGFDAPDPDNVQYRAMINAVRQLKDLGMRITWIWADYLCIPQQNKVSQQNAIDSLSVYVALSSVFVAVAPTCRHGDLPGTTLDLSTYNGRGWCRLEQLSYLSASISKEAPAAFASTESGLQPLWGDGTICCEEDALAVIDGNFSCCARQHPGGCTCDKTKIVGVMLGIYWKLLAWRRDLPDPSKRLMKTLQRLEENIDRFFPGHVAYETSAARPDGDIEVFGDLVPVLQKMFQQDCLQPVADRIQVSPPSVAEMPALSEKDFSRQASPTKSDCEHEGVKIKGRGLIATGVAL